MSNPVKIKILKVDQNIGEFYVGVVPYEDLKDICFAEERRNSWDDLEKYIGMQRPLNTSRVGEIQAYTKTMDATFPNSIILALKEEAYEMEGDNLVIKRDKSSANILDGQHRLAGFPNNNIKKFDLIVTFFPDLSLEDQAYLFSVINTKQTKINPSLAQELYAYAKIESPQKIAHTLAVEFNRDQESPFYKLIKRLGKKEPYGTEIISQSTFASRIIELICNPKHSYIIRDNLKKFGNKREPLKEIYKDYDTKKYIFWEPYLEGREDFIYKVLKSFFNAVRDTFDKEWGDNNFILTKTIGYTALIKFFKDLYKKGYEEKDLTYNFFKSYMDNIKNSSELKDFTATNYPPGGRGETALFRDLLKMAKLKK